MQHNDGSWHDGLGREIQHDYRRRPPGAVVGLVTDNNDPDGWGRIKVRFPWLHDSETSHWARIAQTYAGPGRGSFWLPEIGDEVVVVFDRRDPNHPYILGGVWNGKDAVPPPGNPDGKNNHKIWRTRAGHQVIFDDTAGAEKITLTDGANQRHLVIDVAADTITLTAAPGDITFEAPANTLTVDCKTLEIDVKSSSTYTVDGAYADTSDTRSETITGADTLTVDTTWNVGAPSTSVSATTSTLAADTVGATVSGALTMSSPGGRKVKSKEVRRTSPVETLTVGVMDVKTDEAATYLSNGPITVTAGATTLNVGDATLITPAILQVQSASVIIQAKTALTGLAQMVKLC